MREIFEYQNFLKHRRFPYDFARHCETKTFDGKTWYPPPYQKFFFLTRMFLKHKGLPSYDIFRHCSTKTFRRKNVIHPSDPQISFIPDFFWITRIPPTKFFGLVRQRKRHNRVAPLPLPILCMKFLNFRIFQNTEALPYKFFQHCGQKTFDGKTKYPPLIINFSPYQNVSEKQGSPSRIFWHCETNRFWQENVIPPR